MISSGNGSTRGCGGKSKCDALTDYTARVLRDALFLARGHRYADSDGRPAYVMKITYTTLISAEMLQRSLGLGGHREGDHDAMRTESKTTPMIHKYVITWVCSPPRPHAPNCALRQNLPEQLILIIDQPTDRRRRNILSSAETWLLAVDARSDRASPARTR